MLFTDDGSRRLMSIREVSEITGVPPHTLRFWEKEMPEILCPRRTAGRQRRYDWETLERVREIKHLSDEKRYSLATIRKLLGNGHVAPPPLADPQTGASMDQIVDFIVDEISDLLKERLVNLLGTRESRRRGDIPG